MSVLYSTKALCERAGITFRQADYWTRQGYLSPVEVEGIRKGSGNYRAYEASEVEVAKLLGALAGSDGGLEQVARLVRGAVYDRPESLHGYTLSRASVVDRVPDWVTEKPTRGPCTQVRILGELGFGGARGDLDLASS